MGPGGCAVLAPTSPLRSPIDPATSTAVADRCRWQCGSAGDLMNTDGEQCGPGAHSFETGGALGTVVCTSATAPVAPVSLPTAPEPAPVSGAGGKSL